MSEVGAGESTVPAVTTASATPNTSAITALGHGGFVAPSSYLRPAALSGSITSPRRQPQPLSVVDREQAEALVRTSRGGDGLD
jgi:hypothetical protein